MKYRRWFCGKKLFFKERQTEETWKIKEETSCKEESYFVNKLRYELKKEMIKKIKKNKKNENFPSKY